MASSLEPDLTCSICHDFFRDPVVLSCSHSFCKDCLQTWWEQSPIMTCPFCQRRCKRYTTGPPLNLALRNLVEVYKRQRASEQPECSLHSEKLRLFCLDHQELICLVCRDSTAHTGHKFSPIEEAAPDLREQLRSSMEPLQKKLKELNVSRAQFDDAVAHISAQAQRTAAQIRAEFQKKHQFLLEEEESKMKALREEEKKKTRNMKDKLAAVSREIETVSKTISETEEQLRAADASFLLQYKSALGKVRHCPLVEVPKMERGALIDQAKHLGNLGFHLWSRMGSKVQFYPVSLDPNTAGPELILSDDLTTVRCGERKKVPANPGRCVDKSVFGQRRFIPGSHSFDVDVSGNKFWTVGVGGEVQREADTRRGTWGIRFSNNEYTARSTFGFCTRLSVKNLQRVRVKLDRDQKTLTFMDLDTHMELYTFTDTFSFTVVPYLSLDTSLKILPKAPSGFPFLPLL